MVHHRGMMALALPLVFVSVAKAEQPTVIKAPAITQDVSNAWVEINKAIFERNIDNLQKLTAGKTRICAVMKANAYGHGVNNLISSVIKKDINCIGVAANREARVARDNGFKGQIVRLRTATLEEMAAGVQYDIEELVGNAEVGRELTKLAKENRKTIRYHLALNSAGMSRNGLELATDQGKKDALEILHSDGLELTGIMTHFAVEEREDTLKGLARFKEESAWVIKEGGLDRSKITLHAANSFATLEVPEAWLDMIRPGGLLYGDTVASHPEYAPVMSLKSSVASVNSYPAGNTVGYDRTATLARASLLANIPIGYSDGYRRALTNNNAFVIIHGQRVPTIGKVSMNTLMVDVTDLKDAVQEGDEVVLFGEQGSSRITRNEIEEQIGVLWADIYTQWGRNPQKVVSVID